MGTIHRRAFLAFMGASSGLPLLARWDSDSNELVSLKPSAEDELALLSGLNYRLFIAWGDPINKQGDLFGYDNDFIAFIPGEAEDEATMWVNHESIRPFLMNGSLPKQPRRKEAILQERLAVGGSILKIRRKDGAWSLDVTDPSNRRIHADTDIPFKSARPIEGSMVAKGTLANCAGGVTPWRTFLTCEENYDDFFGEVSFDPDKGRVFHDVGKYGWSDKDPRPPEHYGWVVEVDPRSGKAAKLTALGRFSHESATCVLAADERCVVYSGDDSENECLYKFIADRPGSLEHGKLYVADLAAGRWLLLDHLANPKLKGHFSDQTELLIRTREAAHLAGGSTLDRPEDIEIQPGTGDVFVTLTNNTAEGNYHGSILRIHEKDANPLALEFKHEVFLVGGSNSGFSCPDNLVFDRKGNLWFTCDVSETKMNKGVYQPYGNNALYYVALSGPAAGKPIRVAIAPTDAEFTGPCFSPDHRKLFLSVQHPGSTSKPGQFTSHWPDGGESKPRPGVIVIEGPLLDRLLGST